MIHLLDLLQNCDFFRKPYVDPDEGGINTHVDEALKAEKYGMEEILVWL
jgi:hypothetical protein